MTFSNPIAWSSIEAYLVGWVLRSTGLQAIWARQNAPQPARPFALLNWVAGPTRLTLDAVETEEDFTRVASIRITPEAADSTTYTVALDGTDYSYTSGVGAAVADVTAGLYTLIDAAGYTTADNGSSLDVASADGSTFAVVLSDDGAGDLMSFANLDAGHEIQLQYIGPRRMTLAVDVFSDSGQAARAADYSSILEGSIASESETIYRAALGLGFLGTAAMTDLSTVEGSRFIERHHFDLFLCVPYALLEDVGYITQLSITAPDLDWSAVEFGE